MAEWAAGMKRVAQYGHYTGRIETRDQARYFRRCAAIFRPEGSPQNRRAASRWCALFYGDWCRLIWAEPPFSPEGKSHDVWHYRVFTDPTFSIPMLPVGEVYSRELTERGWKSWSDLHDEAQETAHT